MKSTSWIYKSWKWIMVQVGYVELHGCPIPFCKKARGFDISGAEQRAVLDLLEPGDILLGRYTHHLTGYLIPGDWDHSGIYVGGNKIVHITGEGVSLQDPLEFMERDAVAVLRLPQRGGSSRIDVVSDLVSFAKSLLGEHIEYDYEFDFSNSLRLSCSELVRGCLCYAFDASDRNPTINLNLQPAGFGKLAYTPDDIFKSGLDVVHESTEWRNNRKLKGASK